MRDRRDTIRIKVTNVHASHFGIEDDKIHELFDWRLPGWVVLLNLGDSESPGRPFSKGSRE